MNPPRPLSKSSASGGRLSRWRLLPPRRACGRSSWRQGGAAVAGRLELRGQRTITSPRRTTRAAASSSVTSSAGHAGRVTEEHAARPVDQFCRGRRSGSGPLAGGAVRRPRLVVQNDQVQPEAAAAPVRVRLQEPGVPAPGRGPFRFGPATIGTVAGDAVRPQSRLAQTVASDGLRATARTSS